MLKKNHYSGAEKLAILQELDRKIAGKIKQPQSDGGSNQDCLN